MTLRLFAETSYDLNKLCYRWLHHTTFKRLLLRTLSYNLNRLCYRWLYYISWADSTTDDYLIWLEQTLLQMTTSNELNRPYYRFNKHFHDRRWRSAYEVLVSSWSVRLFIFQMLYNHYRSPVICLHSPRCTLIAAMLFATISLKSFF